MKKFMFVSMMVFVAFIMACAQQQMVSNSGSAGGQQGEDREDVIGETKTFLCFESDFGKDFFACTGMVETTKPRMGEAFRKALVQAQNACLNKVEHIATGLNEEYTNTYGTDRGNDAGAKMEEGYRNVLKTVMKETSESCKEYETKKDRNGRFAVFVGIKIPRKDVADALKKETPNLVGESEKEKLDSQANNFLNKIDSVVENHKTRTADEEKKYIEEHKETLD